MVRYRLSAELRGHTGDVRCCAWIDPDSVVTGSRDSKLIVWKRERETGSSFAPAKLLEGHGHFVNAVGVLRSDLIVSGSADKTIRIWNTASGEYVNVMADHSMAVCSLFIARESMEIISCSWDQTARLWQVSEMDGVFSTACKRIFQGHEAAVWDAMMLGSTVLTASADRTIKVWDKDSGMCLSTLSGHTDVVRSLAAAPKGFASVSNDSTMRFWTGAPGGSEFAAGATITSVHGDHYIYALASQQSSTDGSFLFVTGGEDNSAKVSGTTDSGSFGTLSSLPHPGCVWSVDMVENGDIITGCSDSVARIFTTDATRFASEEVIAEHERTLSAQKVSTKVIGGVNTDTLPEKDEALKQPGAKDGENKIVRNGTTAEVYMWSQAESEWLKVGDVVDNPNDAAGGGSSAGEVNGVKYDYVFDVDLGDNLPKQKLGYNRGENIYEAAQRFIDQHELSQDFLDQIATFITQNVGSDANVTAVPAVSSDPLTGASRYVPGSGGTTGQLPQTDQDGSPLTTGRYRPGGGGQATPRPTETTRHIPSKDFELYRRTDQQDRIASKLRENNALASTEGDPTLALSAAEMDHVVDVVVPKLCASEGATIDLEESDLSWLGKALGWREDLLVPVLDLARLAVVQPSGASYLLESQDSILPMVLKAVSSTSAKPPVLILGYRFLCNLFATTIGSSVAESSVVNILESAGPHGATCTNRRARETYAALLRNYCIALGAREAVRAPLKSALNIILGGEKDEEVLYRLMVAAGTAMSASKDVVDFAREAHVTEAAVAAAPVSTRLTNCANELAQLLVN